MRKYIRRSITPTTEPIMIYSTLTEKIKILEEFYYSRKKKQKILEEYFFFVNDL